MPVQKGQDLKLLLQRAQEGYAYQVMALEIELQQKPIDNDIRIQSLSRLLQLYMMGVEFLQSKSDQRYKYFNNKIQQLMKRKVILQQMQKTASKKLDPQLLLQARRKQLGERKEEYDLQIYLNSDQLNERKIKQIVDLAENKRKRFENRIKTNITTQDEELQNRIKMRKMRSEVGSVQKFKLVKGQVVDRNIAGEKTNMFFDEEYNPKQKGGEKKGGLHEKLGIFSKSYQFI